MFTKTYHQRTVWRFFGLMAVGVFAVAFSMFCIGKANADDSEQDYLAEITNGGVGIRDVRGTVRLGYEICSDLPTTNGTTEVYEIQANNPSFTRGEVAVVVMAAVHNLCPAQYHPERLGVSA